MEVTVKPASSNEIDAKIIALDRALAGLEQEASQLSYEAVSGDRSAAQKLSAINAKIEGASADRIVLERARRTATDLEAAAAQSLDQERRNAHYESAGEHAVDLLTLADRADGLIREFGVIIAQIETCEKAIWRELQAAKAAPAATVTGRHNVASYAFANVANVQARGDFANKTTVADVVSVAWRFLLDPNGDLDGVDQ